MKRTKEEIHLRRVVRQQDQIIGRLTRENAYLTDHKRLGDDWIRMAKADAGYPDRISFDRVWEAALRALHSVKAEMEGKE